MQSKANRIKHQVMPIIQLIRPELSRLSATISTRLLIYPIFTFPWTSSLQDENRLQKLNLFEKP